MTTDAVGIATAIRGRGPAATSRLRHDALPVAVVVLAILAVWYAAAVWLNAAQVIERFGNEGTAWTARDLASAAWSMQRPVLPWQFSLPPQWVASMGSSTDKMISATVISDAFLAKV